MPLLLERWKTWYIIPVLLPIIVAIAAPSMPSFGKGPMPRMSIGSRIMFIPFAIHSERIASAASPAPRKIPLIKKRRITITLLAKINFVYPAPSFITSDDAPIKLRRSSAKNIPANAKGRDAITPM